MSQCKTCRWAFPVRDHESRLVLLCWPAGDRFKEQIAAKECAKFEREVAAVLNPLGMV